MTRRYRLLTLLLCALRVPAAWGDSLSPAGSPSPASTFDLTEKYVSGLSFLTDFRFLPDGRMVLITQTGNAYVRPAGGGVLVLAGTFPVNVPANFPQSGYTEQGLLGVAVDPDFAGNNRLYFYYSAAAAAGGTDLNRNRVVRRTLDGANQLGAETILLDQLRGPGNHVGGGLEVGPDGFLYVSVGDAGCANFATCLSDSPGDTGAGNGKILRLTRDGGTPPGNPLVGAGNVTACAGWCLDPIAAGQIGAPRTAAFAWGFRNPFRIWVDPLTGLVWAGDVGEADYEEIDIVVPGRHHGWPWREARHGAAVTTCRNVRVGTNGSGNPIQDGDCIDPAWECSHANGCSAITGGMIVDSCPWPEAFRGRYVFGDSSTGQVWTLTPNAGRNGIVEADNTRTPFATIMAPVAFRTGPDGALYVASYSFVAAGSYIDRIAPKTPATCATTTTSSSSSSTSTSTSTSSSTSTSTSSSTTLTTIVTSTSSTVSTSSTSTWSTVSTSSTSTSSSSTSSSSLTSTSTTAPTSTTSSSTTTSSTAPRPTTTTSTTVPGPCATETGTARARCEVDGALAAPLCDGQQIEPKIARTLRTRLRKARRLLDRATHAQPRKAGRLAATADRLLAGVLSPLQKSTSRGKTTGECQTAVTDLISHLRQEIALARAPA